MSDLRLRLDTPAACAFLRQDRLRVPGGGPRRNTRGDLVEIKNAINPGKFYDKLQMDVGFELFPTGTGFTGKSLKAGRRPAGPAGRGSTFLRGTISASEKEPRL